MRRGVRLGVRNQPRKPSTTPELDTSSQPKAAAEFQRLLDIGAVEPADPGQLRIVAKLRAVVKQRPGGEKVRLVYNGRPLSSVTKGSARTQFDDTSLAMRELPQGTYAASVDVQDAFLHWPLNPHVRNFFGMKVDGRFYRWAVLPFGWSHSPKLQQRLTKAVLNTVNFEKDEGTLLYLDDMLIYAPDKAACLSLATRVIRRLVEVGICPHPEKVDLDPRQRFTYLGVIVDTVERTTEPLPERVRTLRASWRAMRAKVRRQRWSRVSYWWSKLAGLTAWVASAAPLLKLWTRGVALVSWYDKTDPPDDDLIHWACDDVLEGLDRVPLRKRWDAGDVTKIYMQTDASPYGWGVACPQLALEAAGRWSPADGRQHITYLETKAATYALELIVPRLPDTRINLVLQSDATCTVSTFANTVHSVNLIHAARETLLWATTTKPAMTLTASHLAGVLNTTADRLSRLPRDTGDYMLCDELSNDIKLQSTSLWGRPPVTDVFAAAHNHQCETFISENWQPGAWRENAWLHDWNTFADPLWVNPPWTALDETVSRLINLDVTAVLIAPVWPATSWLRRLQRSGRIIHHTAYDPFRGMFLRDHRGGRGAAMPRPKWSLGAWYLGSAARQWPHA